MYLTLQWLEGPHSSRGPRRGEANGGGRVQDRRLLPAVHGAGVGVALLRRPGPARAGGRGPRLGLPLLQRGATAPGEPHRGPKGARAVPGRDPGGPGGGPRGGGTPGHAAAEAVRGDPASGRGARTPGAGGGAPPPDREGGPDAGTGSGGEDGARGAGPGHAGEGGRAARDRGVPRRRLRRPRPGRGDAGGAAAHGLSRPRVLSRIHRRRNGLPGAAGGEGPAAHPGRAHAGAALGARG